MSSPRMPYPRGNLPHRKRLLQQLDAQHVEVDADFVLHSLIYTSLGFALAQNVESGQGRESRSR